MDRFIVKVDTHTQIVIMSLKSNMDRFIAAWYLGYWKKLLTLKSNMDRFIAEMGISDVENMQHFKIQYG